VGRRLLRIDDGGFHPSFLERGAHRTVPRATHHLLSIQGPLLFHLLRRRAQDRPARSCFYHPAVPIRPVVCPESHRSWSHRGLRRGSHRPLARRGSIRRHQSGSGELSGQGGRPLRRRQCGFGSEGGLAGGVKSPGNETGRQGNHRPAQRDPRATF